MVFGRGGRWERALRSGDASVRDGESWGRRRQGKERGGAKTASQHLMRSSSFTLQDQITSLRLHSKSYARRGLPRVDLLRSFGV